MACKKTVRGLKVRVGEKKAGGTAAGGNIGELSRHMCSLSMPAESGKGLFLGVGGTAYCQIIAGGAVMAGITLETVVWYGKGLLSAIRGSSELRKSRKRHVYSFPLLVPSLSLLLKLSLPFFFRFSCSLSSRVSFVGTLLVVDPHRIHRDRLVLLPQQHDKESFAEIISPVLEPKPTKNSPPTTSPGTANRPFLSICSRNGPVTAC